MSCCRPMHLEIADYQHTIRLLEAENAKLRKELRAHEEQFLYITKEELPKLRNQRDRLRILVEELRLEVCYTSQHKISTILAEIDSTARSAQGEGK